MQLIETIAKFGGLAVLLSLIAFFVKITIHVDVYSKKGAREPRVRRTEKTRINPSKIKDPVSDEAARREEYNQKVETILTNEYLSERQKQAKRNLEKIKAGVRNK